METYTKLFMSILDSTIWQEDAATRIVWITLLAKKDKNGLVNASLPGLAHAARVTLEECQEAVKKFMEPDEYSRTKDDDGRRIKEVEGGWLVLNHFKYRDEVDGSMKRERDRLRQREYRRGKPLKGEVENVRRYENGQQEDVGPE